MSDKKEAIVNCQRVFTLLELLIVIAIIAMLCSILLPSLTKAKGTARGIQCFSNLKQVQYAVAMYCGDYDGYYFNNYGSFQNNFSGSGIARLAQYVGGPDFSDMLNNASLRNDSKIPKVFFCPSLLAVADQSKIGCYTYGMSRDSDSADFYSQQILKVQYFPDISGGSAKYSPNQLVLIADSYNPTFTASSSNALIADPYNPNYAGLHARHAGYIHVVHVDGQVEKAKPDDLFQKRRLLINRKVGSFWFYFNANNVLIQ